jgi:protein-tyrosine kinase
VKMPRVEFPRYGDVNAAGVETPFSEGGASSSGLDVSATDSDFSRLPAQRQPATPLGMILVASGILSMEDIDRVLAHQKERGIRFGEAAVELELATSAEVQRALARQYSYPYLLSPPDAKSLSSDLVAAYEPYSVGTEHLRAIRSQLLLHWHRPSEGRQVLTVVGANPGEGRSYLSANLAVLFAQMGERTLLIDANLRTPRLHTMFMLRNQVGLSSVLAGLSSESASVAIAELPGLTVLPAGPIPPNPVELLHGRRFELLLRRARAGFSVIIIDTPSIAHGEEAVVAAVRSDGVLAIASKHQTRKGAFAEMMHGLQQAGASVIGTVLNDAAVQPIQAKS